jgi:hypothetical protein
MTEIGTRNLLPRVYYLYHLTCTIELRGTYFLFEVTREGFLGTGWCYPSGTNMGGIFSTNI